MNFVHTMGFKVFNDNLENISKSKKLIIINTISPNSYGISTKDYFFREALKKSDYLVLDGVYFALSTILMQRKSIKKNQGPDVFSYFINKVNTKKGKVFFLGSTQATLDKINKKLKCEYPDIVMDSYSPPFKAEFNDIDNYVILDKINKFNPDVLFVGMTCPKQEKWVYRNKDKINASYAISIGAVFDWYAGNEKEIASMWWRLNLAWLIRTINRPEILKRFPNIGIFFLHLLFAIIGIKKYKNGEF